MPNGHAAGRAAGSNYQRIPRGEIGWAGPTSRLTEATVTARSEDGAEAVKALSWVQVEAISKRFIALKPYDPEAVSGSILKIEDDNFDPNSGKQRQIWCFAISAKHYALFVFDSQGNPSLLRKGVNSSENQRSEHGLGHLLNPTNPEDEDREWIAQIWLKIIREGLALPNKPLVFESVPAIGRITVSSPAVMRPLAGLNEGKKYSDQINPFNFLLSYHVRPLGHPVGADPLHFHLIAPYETDPKKWVTLKWIDQYSGTSYRISTTDNYGGRKTARVKTYGDCRLHIPRGNLNVRTQMELPLPSRRWAFSSGGVFVSLALRRLERNQMPWKK